MTLLIIVIVLGIIFDFINGFHDAANSIATIVTTRVLTPFQAVLWAAAFNFLAFFVAPSISLVNLELQILWRRRLYGNISRFPSSFPAL